MARFGFVCLFWQIANRTRHRAALRFCAGARRAWLAIGARYNKQKEVENANIKQGDKMTREEYRREYKRRFMQLSRARARGFDTHKTAFVALKLIERGFTAEEVREVLYFGAQNGFFGTMCTERQK